MRETRDVRADGSLLRQRASERHARFYPLAHGFERALRYADQSHAVVNPAGPQTALRDFKSASFAQQKISGRHAHVLKQNLAVAVRSVIVSEDGEQAFPGHARARPSAPRSWIAACASAPPDRSCP